MVIKSINSKTHLTFYKIIGKNGKKYIVRLGNLEKFRSTENYQSFLAEVTLEWKEMWSIDLETSLVGLPFDGFEFYRQAVLDNAGTVVWQMN